jgi:hypothetical protein
VIIGFRLINLPTLENDLCNPRAFGEIKPKQPKRGLTKTKNRENHTARSANSHTLPRPIEFVPAPKSDLFRVFRAIPANFTFPSVWLADCNFVQSKKRARQFVERRRIARFGSVKIWLLTWCAGWK